MCAQGCVNGTCVSPGVCQCHFGFVGDNCSSQCSCNKHSNCAGVNKPDVCLECHNNTIVSAFSQAHTNTKACLRVVPCPQVTNSSSIISRASTVRSVSLCLWDLPREVALVVHVGSFAGETVVFVYPEMNTGKLLKTLRISLWIPLA